MNDDEILQANIRQYTTYSGQLRDFGREPEILLEFDYDKYGSKLHSKYEIYGHTGNTHIVSGYIYAPYIPIFTTAIIKENNTTTK